MRYGANEIIEMLTILKKNSGSLKLLSTRDYTIVMDCKKESFDLQSIRL